MMQKNNNFDDLIFSPLLPSHIDQMVMIEQECFSVPWSREALMEELDNPCAHYVVCTDKEGNVVGYIGSQTVLPEADVMNLAVAPKGRRRGIAKALLTELTGLLHKAGVEMLFLEVRASNAPAITLYEGFGFIFVGRRPKYYVNPTEDALILRKELGKC